MGANQAPEKSFRIGYCQASVFKNTIEPKEGPKRVVRNVVLSRRYQDKEGKWDGSNSFGLADLPSALRVLELAQAYVEGIEAETSP